MTITASTFISDSVKFLRDQLASNITDPIATQRTETRGRFVMTSYPERPVKYPLITVKATNISQIDRLGFQSEDTYVNLLAEVRVWARNIKEKDSLTEQVADFLRTHQFSGSNPSTTFGLHDFAFQSAVDVDEDGENNPKSKVMTYRYKIVLTT